MDPSAQTWAIGVSLGALGLALGGLFVRGIGQYLRTRQRLQLFWAGGMGLASGAMAIETVVYAGVVSSGLLQAYVFLTAALVGVLSLGATRVLKSPRFESGYRGFIFASIALVGLACLLVPIPPSAMVSGNIIVHNPPLLLLLLSTMVTGPATVVLLASAGVSLRRTRHWQGLLMIAGALVLGAGGALYIASFPVALYYAEFIGIVLLFIGLVNLRRAVPQPLARSQLQLP